MICSETPDLHIVDGFYAADESERLYRRLRDEQDWPDNRYVFGGRAFVLPRLQTWHADSGVVYSYSNNLLETRAWTPLLTEIKEKVEKFVTGSFNAVLVNWYRNGEDYVGWHADNEPELGGQPLIASLTFGAERRFAYRHKKTAQSGHLLLRSGSLLVMQPSFQQHWLHSVPIEHEVGSGRINLTFRKVFVQQQANASDITKDGVL